MILRTAAATTLLAAAAVTEAAIDRLDRNGDGVLTHDEYVQQPRAARQPEVTGAEQRREARFRRLDTNDDGKLTRDELPAGD